MKALALRYSLIFLFYFSFFSSQDRRYELIDEDTGNVSPRTDSLQAIQFLDSLVQASYFFTKLSKVENNVGITKIYYNKGKNYNEIWVEVADEIARDFQKEKIFFTKNLDSLRNVIHDYYKEQGFVFNRVFTRYKEEKKTPLVEISVEKYGRRKIDGFEVRGYKKVPKSFIRNIGREFAGKIYTEQEINKIQSRFLGNTFVELERNPQTLFTRDSTQIYLFLRKKNNHEFNGILGLGNDDKQKLVLNGSLNLQLRNIFDSFEEFRVFWRRDSRANQNFDLSLDFPYLFGTNAGLLGKFAIFRQHSVFASLKIDPSLYYSFFHRERLGVNFVYEISSVFGDNYYDFQARNFAKKGFGLCYERIDSTDIDLFLYKMKIRSEIEFLSVLYDEEISSMRQYRGYMFGENNLQLLGNHFLNIKVEAAIVRTSSVPALNELYRIGGWKSIRGFEEDSLLADKFAYLGTEYRYLVGKQFFFDVFAQYGFISNLISLSRNTFYSLGLGFNFASPVGLMSFQLSNGTIIGVPYRIKEAKVHWGILYKF